MADEDQVKELKGWVTRDRDIATVVMATLRAVEVDTVDELADKHPDTFAAMRESIAAMIDDIPIHTPPGWSR